MQPQVSQAEERVPAHPAHVVPALVDQPPVLPHLAVLREGRAAVLAEDVPDLVVDPLDVPLQVELPVGLEGALVALGCSSRPWCGPCPSGYARSSPNERYNIQIVA